MKQAGTSIIFHNAAGQVLLVLRDDTPSLPYPGMWDLPGGHIEAGESPERCIEREMLEEIETDVKGCALFRVYEFSDRREYVFHQKRALDLRNTPLHEGQMLRWFSAKEVGECKMACGFNEVLLDWFSESSPENAPHRPQPCSRSRQPLPPDGR
ncbi:MAG: NUDIX hydrolase [Chlorobiaceae bacterium]